MAAFSSTVTGSIHPGSVPGSRPELTVHHHCAGRGMALSKAAGATAGSRVRPNTHRTLQPRYSSQHQNTTDDGAVRLRVDIEHLWLPGVPELGGAGAGEAEGGGGKHGRPLKGASPASKALVGIGKHVCG